MTPTHHPYPAYKPSGVLWLGDVPEHWEVARQKDVGYLKSGAGFPHSYQGSLSAEFPFFKVGDMAVSGNERLMRVWKHTVSSDTVNVLGAHVFLPNTIVFAKVGAALLLNRRRVLTRPSCIDNNMMGFLPRGHSTEWMCYWLSTVDFRMVVNPGAVPSVNEGQLEVLPVLVPPLPEQRAIVRYLDYVDRRIRRYVSAKRKLIALLEEEKQAVVNRAVTRGLDPHVRLKPSGVEWLGDVPEHWETMRARFLFKEVDTRSTTGTETHLSMSQTLGLVPSNLVEQSLISDSYVGGKLCREGDLVLNRLKAHLGVFALAKQSGVISPDYSVFRKLGSVKMEYFLKVLRLPALRKELRVRAKGIVEGFWRLYTEDFFDIRLPVPSAGEQEAIIEYLGKATSDIEAAIVRARRQTELVQEYRTRLIADVVTGKLDVRAAAAQLPDETDDQDPIEESGPLADGLDEALYDAEESAMEREVTA